MFFMGDDDMAQILHSKFEVRRLLLEVTGVRQ